MKLTSSNLFKFNNPTVSNELFGMGSKAPALKGDRSDVATIKETFLNDAWLDKQKFKTGAVSYSNGTFILPNYGDSFKAMLGAYQKCIYANVATVEKFEQQLKPFVQFITSDPKGKNPQLVAAAQKLKVGELLPTPVPPTKSVDRPDKAGVKALANAYLQALADRTNFISVEGTIEGLTDEWYGANSPMRRKTDHDSDGDLIARAVAGKVEQLIDADLYLEYQSNSGVSRAKEFLLKDIIKLLKATV